MKKHQQWTRWGAGWRCGARAGILGLALSLTLAASCGDDDGVANANNDNQGDPTCGNGILEAGEQCDDGDQNSDAVPGACRTDCREAWCGDGVVDSGEDCDKADLAQQSCEGLGHTGGTLACTAGCQLNDEGCTDCGNGLLEAGESCDGSDFGGRDCASENAGQHGTLRCLADCTLDTSECYTCGDGVIEPAESCEPSIPIESCHDLGLSGGQRWCFDCQIFESCAAVCGNAILEAGEECDGPDLGGLTCQDRNPAYVAGELHCSAGCLISEAWCTRCGNGVVDVGEQCDGGDLGTGSCGVLGGTPTCNAACELDLSSCDAAPSCGNGALETGLGEQCDGGLLGGQSCATVAPGIFSGGTLACGANCTFDTTGCIRLDPCGNGALEPSLGEQCDTGDLGGQTCQTLGYPGGSLSCSGVCTFDISGCQPPPSCGNNAVDHPLEQCDGNDLAQQSCLSLGFPGGALGCTPMCQLDTDGCYACGNERLDPGELCDGTEFGGTSCADFGKDTGALYCSPACDAIDASGCSTCGDALVTGLETCDDGNTTAGDGCSASCQVEPGYVCNGGTCTSVCGDGILAGSEQCDDGNLRSHDGCSSACTNEVLQWVDISQAYRPPGRHATAMAHDPVRDRIVLFGGQISWQTQFADTWEFDGVAWAHISSDFLRTAHSMAWDSVAEHVLTVVGQGVAPVPGCSSGRCDTVHTWDATSWILETPQANLPPRLDSAAAFDESRGVLVLFGGTPYGWDTWEYDGTTWTQVSSAFPPPARAGGRMVYDSFRQRVVLFGGPNLNDTWEYTPLGWQQLYPTTSPPLVASSGHAMAYDAGRDRIVMLGAGQTWQYDGDANTWSQVFTQTAMNTRTGMAMVYDRLRRRVVLFGGMYSDYYGNWNLDDTWSLSLYSNLPDEVCTDGADNDGDGLVDCADPDCENQLCPGGHCVSGSCQ